MATAINGTVPGPVLRWREGDTVTLRVTNKLPETSSIHWHGILLPFEMDGVPGLSYEGIAPGETFTYRFQVKQNGTYWYHSHSRFQEQTGVYGPIVVEPRGGERFNAERDYVLMLSDWSGDNPEVVMANLKKMSDFYNFNEPTATDFARDASTMGLQQALAKRKMWNQMRMSPTDLSDVTGHHYTYLVNGASPDGNWTGLFNRGEKVRLRVINGSSQSIFDLRIPGLKMTVVAADGQDVEPVTVDEFRVAAAETYDVIVEPKDDRAYTVFAQSIDRMGYARATLAPRAGMQAEVPAMDAPQWLTMVDMMGSMAMGGDMAGMNHGSMGRGSMDHAAMGHAALHLNGNMERYMWSFDGQKFSDSKPLHFRQGERLRVAQSEPATQQPSTKGMDHGQMPGMQKQGGQVPATDGAMPGMVMEKPKDSAMPMEMGPQMGLEMGSMQGGPPPPDARDPDAYADGLEHGPMPGMGMADNDPYAQLLVDELEYTRSSRHENGLAFDAQAWFGTDRDKLWLKAEGERTAGGKLGPTRTEALWNRAFAPYWGFQAGVRHDLGGDGPSRTWAAFGVQGLAPYWFDLEATGYVGGSGRTAFRLDASYDVLLTQRLILKPRAEVNLYGKNDPERAIGASLSDIGLGLRLRYEISSKFAPYVGVTWSRKFGNTARYARESASDVSETRFVAGVRFWF